MLRPLPTLLTIIFHANNADLLIYQFQSQMVLMKLLKDNHKKSILKLLAKMNEQLKE